MGPKFKVGDRVELTENYGTRKCGECGSVGHVGNGYDGERLIDVRMDTPSLSGSRTVSCYERRLKLTSPLVKVFDSSVFAPQAPAPKAPLPDALYMVSQAADRIFPRRGYDTILKSLMEEMGELSTEIAIKQGTKKRTPSSDGVKGEAVDVFIVAVDMLRATWGDELFTSAFTDKVRAKLDKWEGK